MNPIDYLHATVWCTLRPSLLAGVGVFAIRYIPKGTYLTDYTSNDVIYNSSFRTFTLSLEDFRKIDGDIQKLILDRTIFHKEFHEQYVSFTSPNRHVILQTFMNHSNTPNSEGKFALQNIAQGEEVTEDFTKLAVPMHPLNKKHFSFLKDENNDEV